jgi:hypothetical protein
VLSGDYGNIIALLYVELFEIELYVYDNEFN